MKNVITNAEISTERKRGGTYIEYLTIDTMMIGAKISISYNEQPHYFEVTDIGIDGENLKIRAREVGYYATKFDRLKDLDIRSLLNIPIEVITDIATIRKIDEMSCWC